jgi:NodT family efflux transporter outer membrane factor (OMF) lipoprotein
LQKTFTLSGSFSWDLDLWGRLASTVHENESAVQATAETLAAVRLAEQISLAQTYFALRTAEANMATLRQTVESNRVFLSLTQKRYQSGVAGSADVAAAEAQLQSSQAQLLDQEILRAQDAHAIAVLMGQQPAQLHLEFTGQLPKAPALPALLPTTLLQRRPDIVSAERRVAAANAAVGVAKAALFPDISLNGSGGFRGGLMPKLLHSSQEFWSVGPAVSFSGVNLKLYDAVSEEALGNVDQALSTYRQTVLSAFQEVEDNLVAARQLEKEEKAQFLAWQAARLSLKDTQAQYKAGTQSLLNVITAQNNALVAENTWVAVRNRQLVAIGILLKNAAGPWDEKNLPPVNPSSLGEHASQ